MKKNFSRFTTGIAAVLLAGAGILGALLPGCFNPLVAGSPGVEKNPGRSGRSGGLADVWTEPQPFEVAIQIRQANPDTSPGSRSIAGPEAILLAMRGTDSIRNFAQLIVMDPETRKILFASPQRRKNDTDAGTEFSINNLAVGRTYALFLLMGHWERTYAETSGEDYVYYEDKPPTLLAAGLAEPYLELKGGIQTVTITMFAIQVDTAFTPLKGTSGNYVPYDPVPAGSRGVEV
jgi:hypothetical protein